MSRVITIGSALVDIYVHSDAFHIRSQGAQSFLCEALGEKIELDSLSVQTGGAGGNTAVGFARLGWETAVVAETGKDLFAKLVVDELHQAGVATQYLVKEKKEQTGGSVILIGKDGGRTALVHRGAAAELDVADLPLKAIGWAQWVHLSSIGGKLEVLEALFQQTTKQEIGVSWNPGGSELKLLQTQAEGEALIKKWGRMCQILIMNKEEWQSIAAVHDLLRMIIPEIVITDGSKGGTVLTKQKAPHTYTARQVKSVDDTGAGDSFSVGYVAARMAERSVSEAVRWGVANSAAVVQQIGAKPGLLTRAQIEKMV